MGGSRSYYDELQTKVHDAAAISRAYAHAKNELRDAQKTLLSKQESRNPPNDAAMQALKDRVLHWDNQVKKYAASHNNVAHLVRDYNRMAGQHGYKTVSNVDMQGGDFMDFLRGVGRFAGKALGVSSAIGDTIQGPLLKTILPGPLGTAANYAIQAGNSIGRNMANKALGVGSGVSLDGSGASGGALNFRAVLPHLKDLLRNRILKRAGMHEMADIRAAQQAAILQANPGAHTLAEPSGDPTDSVLPLISTSRTGAGCALGGYFLMPPSSARTPILHALSHDDIAHLAAAAMCGPGYDVHRHECEHGAYLAQHAQAGVPLSADAILRMTGQDILRLQATANPADTLRIALTQSLRPALGDSYLSMTF